MRVRWSRRRMDMGVCGRHGRTNGGRGGGGYGGAPDDMLGERRYARTGHCGASYSTFPVD